MTKRKQKPMGEGAKAALLGFTPPKQIEKTDNITVKEERVHSWAPVGQPKKYTRTNIEVEMEQFRAVQRIAQRRAEMRDEARPNQSEIWREAIAEWLQNHGDEQ